MGPLHDAPSSELKGDDVVEDVIVWVGAGTVDDVASERVKARIGAIVGRFRRRHPHAEVFVVG
jgi:hypothetical protein